MSTFSIDPAILVAFGLVVKASLLLVVAAIVQAVLPRRTSAAMRHLVWTLAMASVLVLPILSLALPAWDVVIRTTSAAAPPAVYHATAPGDLSSAPVPVAGSTPAPVAGSAEAAPPAGLDVPWPMAMFGVYAAGAIVMLIHLMMQLSGVRRCARHSAEVQDADWRRLLAECSAGMGIRRPVRLLRSRERAVPMTFGTRRPAILIPSIGDSWSGDRRRAVILHELAHVVRLDCLTQTLAFTACALYWFHPAAWWVAHRLRIERELACDDRVIAAGTGAREYAGHLLEIAYSFGGHGAPALAVSMARPRHLEGRMLAALDEARNRSAPRVRVRFASAAIAALLLVLLAGATPTIVAADRDGENVLSTAPELDARQRDVELAASMNDIKQPLEESAYRLLRRAAAAVGVSQDRLPGTWEIRPTDTDGVVHLRLVEVNSSSGSNVPIEQLEGLTAAQIAGTGGPIQFRLKRDAGTFTFEGVVRNGVGAGTFSFAADPNFPAELAKRGFARPAAGEQYQMARHDVGFAFVDELNKQGYSKPETSELVRAGQHGVQVTYLRDMGALGYRLGSLDPLIKLRDHGVTPDYVRELAALGYKGLSADDLRQARDHGITPDYVKAMTDAGYGSLRMEELINARDHGVSADFVRGLGDAGHRKLPLEQVIRVRDHGVSPEYARDMRQLGYTLPIEELIRTRDHGVTVEFVRAMAALGYTGLPMDSLVRVRDHGVTPEYAQELKALGYDRLVLDDLVMLRDHGLTSERIRAANARAGSRLPVDLLKSLADGGMR
jgi:beta-lactamase regulating signal transducer with metallopeptidase domain